jgi:hypothetical protein
MTCGQEHPLPGSQVGLEAVADDVDDAVVVVDGDVDAVAG